VSSTTHWPGPPPGNRRAILRSSEVGWTSPRDSPWQINASTPCTRMVRAPKRSTESDSSTGDELPGRRESSGSRRPQRSDQALCPDGDAYAHRVELLDCGEFARVTTDSDAPDEITKLNLHSTDTAIDRRVYSATAKASLCRRRRR
jgi:hypothetical protein